MYGTSSARPSDLVRHSHVERDDIDLAFEKSATRTKKIKCRRLPAVAAATAVVPPEEGGLVVAAATATNTHATRTRKARVGSMRNNLENANGFVIAPLVQTGLRRPAGCVCVCVCVCDLCDGCQRDSVPPDSPIGEDKKLFSLRKNTHAGGCCPVTGNPMPPGQLLDPPGGGARQSLATRPPCRHLLREVSIITQARWTVQSTPLLLDCHVAL